MSSPLDQAVIPSDMAPITARWQDQLSEGPWMVELGLDGKGQDVLLRAEVDSRGWRATSQEWSRLRATAGQRPISLRVRRSRCDDHESRPCDADQVSFSFSADPVAAPIFYRELPLPLRAALAALPEIRWRLGWVSSDEAPQTVLTHIPTCANCHSFSMSGKHLAMDVDYGADKGSFAVVDVEPETIIDVERLVSWNEPQDPVGTGPETVQVQARSLGLLSRVSPDGRYVASTIRETTVHQALPDPDRPQLFFPVRGVIALHDTQSGAFATLPGADHPELVQTNPVWSPDQRWIIFARAPALPLDQLEPGPPLQVPQSIVADYAAGRRSFRFDLYRIPFNNGQGGLAEPIPGASRNGRSNYFPAASPDSRWIVFCQARSFMLNQLDSALYIIPFDGGPARRLRSSFEGRMSSWHSFSPNGRWLVFSSKADGPFTQLWLTHLDESGRDSVPIRLDGFVSPGRAANLPEIVDLEPGALGSIRIKGVLH